MSTAQYRFRCALKGHTDDVRCVATATTDKQWCHAIFTASRDSTIKVWLDSGALIDEKSTLVGHSDFVVALAPMLPGRSTIVPGLGLISGSRDKSVMIWDLETSSVVQQLNGHEYQVNAVGVLPSGEIASAGLDGVLKVWKGGKTIRTLQGHEGAILCMLILPNGDILTGSGDKTIKQWSGNLAHRTFSGHSDSVRALCELPGVGFVSGSHDATLRVWAADGGCLAECVGHTALVYSVAATSDCLIASGSEDTTLRVWNATGECLQVLGHPGCVWSVAFCPSGDIVAGTSDHHAYLWSSSNQRQAGAEEIAAYESLLAERKAMAAPESSSALPEDKIKDASALLMPGAKDNDTIFVREAGKVWAYAWTASAGEWSKLGEVTSGPSSDDTVGAPKKWYNGQEWDFLFDVDVDDNAPALKMPMNRGEDPYDVADRFMQTHLLPVSYREQIVSFILQNTGGSGMQQPMNTDPFTGAGAYVPSNAPVSTSQFSSTFPDPFTGSGAYVPSDTPAQSARAPSGPGPITGGGADPFTGSRTQGSGGAAGASLSYVPHREYQVFEAKAAADKVAAKLKELSNAVDGDLKLSPSEMEPGGALDQALQVAMSGSGGLGEAVISVLGKLARWPAAQLFPVLDVFRLLILNAGHARLLAADAGPLEDSNPGVGGLISRGLRKDAPGATQLTALRLSANCFRQPPLCRWIMGQQDALLDLLAELCGNVKMAARTALATVLLNVAAALCSGVASAVDDARIRVLSMLCEMIAQTQAKDEGEAVFRMFLAAGTVAHGDSEAVTMGRDLGFADQADEVLQSPDLLDRLKLVANDMKTVFA